MPESYPLPENLDQVRRIGIVSDTHIPDRVRALHPDLLPGLRSAEVDLLIHAGDICAPSVLTELSRVAPVVAVRGNRDWAFTGVLPWVRFLSIGGLRIAVHHGMGSFWHYWLDKLRFASAGYQFERYKHVLQQMAPGADVYIFGHTHRGENRMDAGVLYFNPGSSSITPPAWPEPSYGILHLDGGGGVTAEIIKMRRLPVSKGKWVGS